MKLIKSRNIQKAISSLNAAKTQDDAEAAAAVTLAVKSTPVLNQAFKDRRNSKSGTTSNFYNQKKTQASDMGSAFEKPTNLNILSHNDLTSPNLEADIRSNDF